MLSCDRRCIVEAILTHTALHERLSGHASRVRVLDRVLTRLKERDDVWWARKDQIARWLLANPGTAAWVDREPAPISGLPGPSGESDTAR
jgi:hypothetical protein